MDKINATQLAPWSATKLIHRSCFFIFTIDTTPIHHLTVLIPAPSRLNFSRGARVDVICAELRDLWPRVAGRWRLSAAAAATLPRDGRGFNPLFLSLVPHWYYFRRRAGLPIGRPIRRFANFELFGKCQRQTKQPPAHARARAFRDRGAKR
jgi:hypothetical protein